LWNRGFHRLDVIATSHSHADHIGGVAALLRNFRPREFWTGANPEKRLVELARRLGCKVIEWKAPAILDFGGARIDVLAPLPNYVVLDLPKNDDSLVLRATYGSQSFVLAGDAEQGVERQLASSLSPSSVLKLGHHGSKTSSTPEFLDVLHPGIAIVSAGFANQFRHPHPVVLERLEERHIAVLRTDKMGLVSVRTDGKRLWMDTARWAHASSAWWSRGFTD